MRRRVTRPFTIADFLIVIAAIGVVLAVCRPIHRRLVVQDPQPSSWRTYNWISGPLVYAAAIGSLALIVLRLRRPRPPWRRLTRQPGFVACLVTAAVVLVCSTEWVVWANNPRGWMPMDVYIGCGWQIPYAVTSAWLALRASGRWRAEPSWIDRAGRLLGGFWVFRLIDNFTFDLMYPLLPALF